MGPLTLDGAAVLTHEDWVIDIYPLDCDEPLEVDPTRIWKDRRMPPLRVLAFRDDVEEPEVVSANVSAESISPRAPGRHLPLPHHPSRVDDRAGEVILRPAS